MIRALKRIREEKGYTLRALATESGIGVSTINNYENGRHEMSGTALDRLSECLKTPVHELTSWEVGANEDPSEYRFLPVVKPSSDHWKRLFLRLPDEKLEEALRDLLDYKTMDAMDAAREIFDELARRRGGKEEGSKE